ncbi:antitoxin VbhA family protein (plasmid) [Xanthomonas arboricola]|uniref:antitoxin VbhA family protein n=1 Tax=Xanthomonas arboricola TaxID=56448 RepID=UPI002B2DFB89|nr:antitoxin VbhA family protein [Xanthomonas arboricola]
MTDKSLTLAIPPEFAEYCIANGVTPEQVLAAFMDDLGRTADTNGSDDHMRAEAWFDRVLWPDVSDAEDDEIEQLEQRERAMREAEASLRLEGLSFDADNADLRAAWIARTMTGDQVREAIIARAIERTPRAG